MSQTNEAKVMAQTIVDTHKGQAYFNISQACKIVGCGRRTLISGLNQAGILVKKVGPSKRISAYDLAVYMCLERVVPYG